MESYLVAGIDRSQDIAAVVIADAGPRASFQFPAAASLAPDGQRVRELRGWLDRQSRARAVHGVPPRSTGKPVWQELEGHCELALAQAHSNRARRAASGISPTPNDSSGGTWPGN